MDEFLFLIIDNNNDNYYAQILNFTYGMSSIEFGKSFNSALSSFEYVIGKNPYKNRNAPIKIDAI